MNVTATPRTLGKGRLILFSILFTVAAAVGTLGAIGTFSNARSVFHSDGSALGLVAAGEGAVLVVGLVMVGYAVIHLPRPAWMRYLVLGVPLAASVAGAAIAPDLSRSVLYAVTPLGMTVAAELAGMLAHAIVVYRTGVDVEALARTSATTRRLAYLRSKAANHPDEAQRRSAELDAWKVAKRLGADDASLGSDLAEVQRDRLTIAADDALASMFTIVATPTAEALAAQANGGKTPVLEAGPGGTASHSSLADVCTVAGVEEPSPGESLTPDQVAVVLRWLRYSTTPPMSGRQAIRAFRQHGYIATDTELWAAWRNIPA